MKRYILLFAVATITSIVSAQEVLTLDSCRSLALKNNKELLQAQTALDKAYYEHKAAQTYYLPKIDFTGGYMRSSKSVSLLSDSQIGTLGNLGTNLLGGAGQSIGAIGQQFMQQAQQIIATNPELGSLISPLLPQIQQGMTQLGAAAGQAETNLNGVGQKLVDALDTDTRNVTAGAVLFTQPLYMGGKIRAYDHITNYAQQLAGEKMRANQNEVILSVDQAYWQVVNLTSKQKLAIEYRDMLAQLEKDVDKMIEEGVATKSNKLAVSVKLNEAEMTVLKVEDGLSLSRMLLCQLCDLPFDSQFTLADEGKDSISTASENITADVDGAWSMRPEIKQLELASSIYDEKVKIELSNYLPTLALTGGYGFSNPAVTHGFENRFRGMWAVGVMLKVPVWNWLESKYKVRAAKAEALGYKYQLEEAKSKIALQVNQQTNRVNESNRKLQLAIKNLDNANENLRVAQVGHHEGVITTTDLLGAQVAWLSAYSNKIDAEVDIQVAKATLANVLGL